MFHCSIELVFSLISPVNKHFGKTLDHSLKKNIRKTFISKEKTRKNSSCLCFSLRKKVKLINLTSMQISIIAEDDPWIKNVKILNSHRPCNLLVLL